MVNNEVNSNTLNLIVPIYGEIASLNQFVEWVIKIKNPGWDIKVIAVFDGTGTRKSNQNLRDIKDLDVENLVIIEGKFGSPGLARNAGLQESDAEWIIFCDADDSPKLHGIMTLIEEIKISEIDTIVGSFEIGNMLNSSTSAKKLDHKRNFLNYLSVSSTPGIWRFIFKNDSLTGLEFSDLKMGEDQLFLMEYFSKKRDIKFSENVIYTYNKGVEGQLTSKIESKREIVKCLSKSRAILRQSINSNLYSAALQINMYFRQSISGIKYGNYVEKKTSVGHLLCAIGFAVKVSIDHLRRKD